MIGKFESGYKAWPSSVTWTVMPNSRNLNLANASRILARTMHALTFEQYQIGCWDRCEVGIKEKECLVKDRKIDWSQPRRLNAILTSFLPSVDLRIVSMLPERRITSTATRCTWLL